MHNITARSVPSGSKYRLKDLEPAGKHHREHQTQSVKIIPMAMAMRAYSTSTIFAAEGAAGSS